VLNPNALQRNINQCEKKEIETINLGSSFSMTLRRQFKRLRNLKPQSLQSIKNEDTQGRRMGMPYTTGKHFTIAFFAIG
jgi:hypothetical protein